MIKKNCSLILCIIFLCSMILSVSAKDYIKDDKTFSIQKLQSLDIVRTPFEKYDENSTINRRSIFEMAYIVVNSSLCSKTLGQNPRQYLIHPDPNKNLYGTQNMEDCIATLEHLKKENEEYGNSYYEFEDIQYASNDHFLAFSLMGYGLINGVEKDGKRYAEFDRMATKAEAITVMCYMFDPLITQFFGEGTDGFKVESFFKGENYIELAKELNVIDENYSMENLDEPINAYEFMNMFYNALNIPFEFYINGWRQTKNEEYCYIDAFSEIDIREADSKYEAIVN